MRAPPLIFARLNFFFSFLKIILNNGLWRNEFKCACGVRLWFALKDLEASWFPFPHHDQRSLYANRGQ